MAILMKGGSTPQAFDLHEAFFGREGWWQATTATWFRTIISFAEDRTAVIPGVTYDTGYVGILSGDREVKIDGVLTFAADGTLLSGRVHSLHVQADLWPGGASTLTLRDIDISAAAVMAAARSAGTADDQRLLDPLLRGDDFVYGARMPATDRLLRGYGGDDLILATDGAARLMGDKGNDLLETHDSRDWLQGGAGNDLLLAGAGADRLFGGAGDDVLAAQGGADSLTGGAGRDDFVFSQPARGVVIRDFTPGLDRLLLDHASGLDLQDLQMTETDQGLRLRIAGLTLTLNGMTAETFSTADIRFADLPGARVDAAVDTFLAGWHYA